MTEKYVIFLLIAPLFSFAILLFGFFFYSWINTFFFLRVLAKESDQDFWSFVIKKNSFRIVYTQDSSDSKQIVGLKKKIRFGWKASLITFILLVTNIIILVITIWTKSAQ
ncbi:MAG: hypothetical protein HY606_15105 [Planctomycetes bacterium]|nr:hypothetical protein [Planctomycetota bacterium]